MASQRRRNASRRSSHSGRSDTPGGPSRAFWTAFQRSSHNARASSPKPWAAGSRLSARPCLARYARVRYWAQDESNFSLRTVLRRRITRCGVRPRVKTKSTRKGYSLYGAVEVRTGEHFFLEGGRMNADGFQAFLDGFAEKHPADFHVMQVDNARFHTAARLVLPDNVMLLYQPPYSPEVNPIEQVWGWAKGEIAGEIFETYSGPLCQDSLLPNLRG
ncbi:MAG: IS630 family transposase [Proteobacteria bacterium]|nr:IS630 family transposase [Pseudomonadota bacterium]